MRKVKISDSKPNRIHVRLTDKEFCFLKDISEAVHLSPCDYIRKLIDVQMYNSEVSGNANK